jgi:heterodisulfide reductase subunit C
LIPYWILFLPIEKESPMQKTKETATFLSEVAAYPGGEKIRLCMQCGTCTGSCPTADKMDHSPSELIEMMRAGLREEVLSSNAPWHCLACYTCTVRCPRGVKITDMMHALERLALKYNKANRKSLTPFLYRNFNKSIYDLGRIAEFSLMVRYYLQTNPFRALGALPVAWGLLSHGRLVFGNPKVSPAAKKQIRAILDKAAALGGDQ